MIDLRRITDLRPQSGPSGLKGRVIDVVLVALALFHGYVAAYVIDPVTMTATVVGAFGIFFRRSHPWACLLVSLPGLFLADAVVAPLVALYSLAAAGLAAKYLAPLAFLLMVGFSAFWRGYSSFDMTVFLVTYAIFCNLAALAAGMLVRTREDLSRSLSDLRSARSREIERVEADARDAERTRLAREMHDVVSHQVSLVAVQAGALQVRSDDPEVVEKANTIRRLAVKAIEELRHMVSVLRDQPDEPAKLGPSKGLRDLGDLIEESGLEVRSDVRVSVDLPPQVERAIYRTVQEGLTNARKYSPGSSVSIECVSDPERLRLVIANGSATNRPEVADSSGHGLIGLTERADSIGGTLVAGPTADGGFRIALEVPLPTPPAIIDTRKPLVKVDV